MAKRVKSSKIQAHIASKFLPFDLINSNILPRFPAKSLVRFTSVCKTWESLIKSPQFIIAHFKLINDRPSSQQSHILKGKSCYSFTNNQLPIILDKVGSMSHCTISKEYPAESCNGVILLKGECCDDEVLWNPTIQKSKIVNFICSDFRYDFESLEFRYQLRGLGFRESNNDYRVVKVMYDVNELCINVVIYSLQTGLWRKVDTKVPNGLIGFNGGVFLNGCVHWLATKDYDFIMYEFSSPADDTIESILFFDFEKECFGEIQFPGYFDHEGTKLVSFNEFRGKLCAVFFDSNVDKCFVWVMREYGVTDSWTNELVISIPKNICGSPLGFTKNGMVVCEVLMNIACSNERETRSSKTRKEVSGLILLDNGKYKKHLQVIDLMDSLALLCEDDF